MRCRPRAETGGATGPAPAPRAPPITCCALTFYLVMSAGITIMADQESHGLVKGLWCKLGGTSHYREDAPVGPDRSPVQGPPF